MDKHIKKLKRAYRKFYFKTRDSDLPPHLQDLLLEKIVNEKLIQSMENRMKENPDISQEKLRSAILQIKELINQWKDEVAKHKL